MKQKYSISNRLWCMLNTFSYIYESENYLKIKFLKTRVLSKNRRKSFEHLLQKDSYALRTLIKPNTKFRHEIEY